MERWDDGAGLRWLFIDLNSFFASVEQQMNPAWRGRPVIVRPAPSEYTCAIAASYEARPFGIRTGTQVMEARKLCRELIVAEARPDLYVEIHHAIMSELDRHIPISKVGSIDEASCELLGPERLEANAVALARRIQAGIRQSVGQCLRSSVGLAPSRFLAKTACGMMKPDGLTVLRMAELPGPLLNVPLAKFPGIGPRMQRRLDLVGVSDTATLWGLSAKQMRALWNSIEGERIWRGLHGLDSADPAERPRATISHSHVLAKEMRTATGARAVARRLVVKCGARLRRMELTGAGLSLSLRLADGVYGRRSGWGGGGLYCPLRPTQDTFLLLEALDQLWRRLGPEIDTAVPGSVGVGIHRLSPLNPPQRDLFDPDQIAGPAPSLRLSHALDRLNRRFGKDTVSIGPRAGLPQYVGAKIAFNRIPDRDEFWE